MAFVRRLLLDRSGATAIEYALLATLLGVAIATAVTTLGSSLWNRFANIANTQ